MSDNFIVGVITSIEDDEYPVGKTFKKVTLGTGQVLKVKHGREDALYKKWGLLRVGVAIKFTMKDYTTGEGVKIPFVFDIETVESTLSEEGVTPELPAEQQAIVDEALAQSVPTIPVKEPAPQAVGMTTKEIGNLIISKDINWIFGKKIALKLAEWYRGQILATTRIVYDGKDLPKFDE